ncbi:MAG: PEP-CTERM sorting domain-containing protein [bacterium]|nr:PEP-CTERM sorting domain-containing protein [bacterium]
MASCGIRRVMTAMLAFLAFVVATAPADAATIQVTFTGIVGIVGDGLSGGPIQVDDVVSGGFVYDTSAEDQQTPEDYGIYGDVLSYGMTITTTTGNYVLTTTGNSWFRVDNDRYGQDTVSVYTVAGMVTGDSINGFAPSRMQWALDSPDLTLLNSDALPSILALQGFDATDGDVNLNWLTFGAIDRQVRWDLTAFSATPVPEPSTALLLGGGLAVLAGRRPRRI